jgi:hypothetical protein
MRTGTSRFSAITWAFVVMFVLFGSRNLISAGIPAVGDFAAFPESGGQLIDTWWSSWRGRDVGSVGSTPSGLGFLGVLAVVLNGSVGFVRTLWILGPIFVGLFGAWRLLAVTGSRRAQIATLVAYVALPLPWGAIEAGSWSTSACMARRRGSCAPCSRHRRAPRSGPSRDRCGRWFQRQWVAASP